MANVVKTGTKKPEETATFKKIVKAIEHHQNENSITGINIFWYVGINNKPQRRFDEHARKCFDKPIYWKCFNAISLNISRAVESYFAKKDFLQQDIIGGANMTSKYVYVYKTSPDFIDRIRNLFNATPITPTPLIKRKKTVSKNKR